MNDEREGTDEILRQKHSLFCNFSRSNPPAVVYTLRDIPIVKRDLFDRKIGERTVKATRQFEISLFRRRKK